MGFKDIVDGEKIAKPIGIRLIENKEGDKDAFEICFEFEEPSTGNPERLYAQLWLSDAAIDRTMDVMVNVLGYNQDIAASKGLEDRGVINFENEVKLVVEGEEYEGKVRPKIKWINRIGGSGFVGATAEIAKTKLNNPRIKAAFDAAKQQDGKKPDAARPDGVKNHAPTGAAAGTKKKLPW